MMQMMESRWIGFDYFTADADSDGNGIKIEEYTWAYNRR